MGLNKSPKYEFILLNLAIIFFVFRGSVPIFKYLFVILYGISMVNTIVFYRHKLIDSFKSFFKNYIFVLIIFLFFVTSTFFSVKVYLLNIKDIFNIIVLVSYIIQLFILIENRYSLKEFSNNLILSIFFVSIFVAIFNLVNIFQIGPFLIDQDQIKTFDYNFALIPIFFGILIIYYHQYLSDCHKYRVLVVLLFIVYFIAILFSGSKRGIFLFFVILFFLLLLLIFSFYKNSKLFQIRKLTKLFSLSILIIFGLFLFFTINSNFYFKEKLIRSFSSNSNQAKENIANSIYRMTTIFNDDSYYSQVYNLIWSSNNSFDPDTWKNTRIHKTIYPLKGNNVEIVPKEAKGYYMDSTCNASYYSVDDLCEAYTGIYYVKVKKGEQYKAFVYCYVSDECEISSVVFGVGSIYIANNIVYGQPSSYYSLDNKGIWKKLEIFFECNNGDIAIYLSFAKHNSRDFSKMNGYVIFAYPHLEKVENKVNRMGEDYISLDYLKNSNNGLSNKSENYFFYNQSTVKYLISSNSRLCILFMPIDSDPIRNFINNLVSEDSTYYSFRTKLHNNYSEDLFGEDRISRWKFAVEIWAKEYNWTQKIFGGGFRFLNWYGYVFLKDKTKTDYPHNPFLHILLYSGIIGVLLYILLLYKVFYYYIKYIKEYYLFFIFFLITYFFTFFSGGNPFDPPIMGFFMMLPFFIHYIHEKEKTEVERHGFKSKVQSLLFKIRNFRS